MEEDSYTKEETKTSKFVNLVHAASLNQPGSLVQPNSTSVTDLSSAYSGFDQGGDTSMDEELNDAQGWPSLSNSNVWSKQNSTLLSSQVSFSFDCLTSNPQALGSILYRFQWMLQHITCVDPDIQILDWLPTKNCSFCFLIMCLPHPNIALKYRLSYLPRRVILFIVFNAEREFLSINQKCLSSGYIPTVRSLHNYKNRLRSLTSFQMVTVLAPSWG